VDDQGHDQASGSSQAKTLQGKVGASHRINKAETIQVVQNPLGLRVL